MLSRCQKDEYSCGREHCRLHNIYEKVSATVRRELDAYTFDAICGEAPEKPADLCQREGDGGDGTIGAD